MSKVFSRCRAVLSTVPTRNNASIQGGRLLARLGTSSQSERIPHRRRYMTPSPTQTSQNSSPVPPPAPSSKLADHLNNVFSPLQFPPDLAARILTHLSHPDALIRNNARLSFIGRRVLQSYILLFLHSSPSLLPGHDYEKITADTVNTYLLGEYVAPKWSVGEVMLWKPIQTSPQFTNSVDLLKMDTNLKRSVGLYKVQGVAVEAIMGGIFHHFGASVAQRVFHTRLLPHLLLPGRSEGLPDCFHLHAQEICERMGGLNGPLVIAAGQKSSSDATPIS